MYKHNHIVYYGFSLLEHTMNKQKFSQQTNKSKEGPAINRDA